jgi:hypothetical protein
VKFFFDDPEVNKYFYIAMLSILTVVAGILQRRLKKNDATTKVIVQQLIPPDGGTAPLWQSIGAINNRLDHIEKYSDEAKVERAQILHRLSNLPCDTHQGGVCE